MSKTPKVSLSSFFFSGIMISIVSLLVSYIIVRLVATPHYLQLTIMDNVMAAFFVVTFGFILSTLSFGASAFLISRKYPEISFTKAYLLAFALVNVVFILEAFSEGGITALWSPQFPIAILVNNGFHMLIAFLCTTAIYVIFKKSIIK